jgi:hypothetical protein
LLTEAVDIVFGDDYTDAAEPKKIDTRQIRGNARLGVRLQKTKGIGDGGD